MARFEPFPGIRYDTEVAGAPLDALVAPPYDIVGEEERIDLEARSPYNAIRVELPVGDNAYAAAAERFKAWVQDKVLVGDEPSFYIYRMGFHDDSGAPRQTTGVLGALELQDPGTGDVLPHEHTTPKAKTDRMELLTATGVNTSPIWGLSLAPGLSGLLEPVGPPDMRVTDDDGVHHRVWRISEVGRTQAISDLIGRAPVVLADGHHRYETALRFHRDLTAPWIHAGSILTYVVELSESELSVAAIHRLLSGFPDGSDVLGALAEWFEVVPTGAIDASVLQRMEEAGALCLHTREGTWLLRPSSRAEVAAPDGLDSSRLEAARASLPPHEIAYQHGWENISKAIERGDADAGVLLRPVSVPQIRSTAENRDRMPPKSTYFFPKPRTGLVYRALEEDFRCFLRD